MKTQGILLILITAVLSAFMLNTSIPLSDDVDIGARGARTKESLPGIVFNSLKMNDFGILRNYIPNDGEIAYLKKQTSRQNQYVFENLSAELLNTNTELNYQLVVDEGIKEGINWASVEMIDSEVNQAGMNDERIYTGMFTVQDLKGETMQVSFDIIRVKNKWFLFQGIRVMDQNKKASSY